MAAGTATAPAADTPEAETTDTTQQAAQSTTRPTAAEGRGRDASGRFASAQNAPQAGQDAAVDEDADTAEDADGAPADTTETPAESRENSAMRQMRAEMDRIRRELQGYKRREDDARREKLTEEQKLKEDNETLRQEVERLRVERLQNQVAAEFKLPATLAARLIGSDLEALRADAADLAKLLPRPRVGSVTEPAKDTQTARIYKRSELMADPELARSPEVLKAYQEGRIVDDLRR
jgi:hypothetical protein